MDKRCRIWRDLNCKRNKENGWEVKISLMSTPDIPAGEVKDAMPSPNEKAPPITKKCIGC